MDKADVIYMYVQIYVHIYGAAQVALVVKNLSANAGNMRDSGSVPGSGRSPGGFQATHSNIISWRIPMDRVAWWVTVPGLVWQFTLSRYSLNKYSKNIPIGYHG